MMDDKNALINFIGNVYGQMKEIDNHIAAAGSNAKFGNRSIDIQNVLKEVVAAPAVQPQPFIQTQPVVQQQFIAPQPAVVPVQQSAGEQQLELSFKTDEKSILNDIYNVLYDIKRLLVEAQKTHKEKPKKLKKYIDCCLCGSQPKLQRIDDLVMQLKCSECKNYESDATEQLVKIKWNNSNKQL
jgi:hypothetical protein